jgi:hypothetical protein
MCASSLRWQSLLRPPPSPPRSRERISVHLRLRRFVGNPVQLPQNRSLNLLRQSLAVQPPLRRLQPQAAAPPRAARPHARRHGLALKIALRITRSHAPQATRQHNLQMRVRSVRSALRRSPDMCRLCGGVFGENPCRSLKQNPLPTHTWRLLRSTRKA